MGIVWLVPIFGIYFAIKVAGAGAGPSGAGKAIGFSLLAIAIMFAGFFAFTALQLRPASLGATALFVVLSVLALFVQYSAWPSLGKVLFAYGLAARIPVVIVMFFAIMENWGTHYDVPPPDFPPDVAWFPKFILIGLVPQMVFWIAFTMIIGGLFGAIAVAISGKKAAPQPAT